MKAKRWFVGGATACALLLLVLSSANAVFYRDWADKFTSSRVFVFAASSDVISTRHFWDGNNNWSRWMDVGVQSVPGRFNAVERVQTGVRDLGCCVCTNTTVTLQRWRVYPAPSVGSSCNAAGLQFVGSQQHTKNTCNFNIGDSFHSARNLPEMNFGAESGVTVNDQTGYRSRLLVQTGTNSATHDGCFKLRWVP